MSRKDYVAFADVIRTAAYLQDTQKIQLAEDLCRVFSKDNHNFDRAKFIAACVEDDA